MSTGAELRGTHSVFRMRVWLARQPLRVAPAWGVVAGALASGALGWRREDALTLFLAVVLADGLWGQLWMQLAWASDVTTEQRTPSRERAPWLPYAHSTAPLAWCWRWLAGVCPQSNAAEVASAWRALLLVLVISIGVSLFLGPAALVLTGLTAVWAMLARFLGSGTLVADLAHSVAEVLLSWLLGHFLFAGLTLLPLSLGLGLGYTLLLAGSLAERSRLGSLVCNLAHLVPATCLVIAKQPLAAGVLGITALPTLAWQPWRDWLPSRGSGSEWYRQHAHIWWWMGMMVAAAAVGWSQGG